MTPPTDALRLSNERTVARCSDGMSPLMKAWRNWGLEREDQRPPGQEHERDGEARSPSR